MDPPMENKRKFNTYSKGSNKCCRTRNVCIRQSLEQDVIKTKLLHLWSEHLEGVVENVEFRTEPFKCCQVEKFLHEDEFLDDLKNELCNLKFVNKINDLYQFRQSVDLSNVNTPSVSLLKSFLSGQCRSWLQAITGIDINGKVALTCSCYSYTDFLLCHDDKCEDRRIAFILYLNKDWMMTDGGALQLFNRDEAAQPKDLVTSIFPQFNSFVFFEVTNVSYHQVAEVLTMDKTRMTVNGWFHGPMEHVFTSHVEPDIVMYSSPLHNVDVAAFHQFLNPLYLDLTNQENISKIFETESEILLVDFVNEELYSQICKSFNNDTIKWEKRGPANRRSYMVAIEDTLDSNIKNIISLMQSGLMFKVLQRLTNLDLASPETRGEGNSSHSSEGNPQCSYEVQQWQSGCYTLINDDDKTFKGNGLDATLYFNISDVREYHGGFTSYIARDADEELLTVTPSHNALALTYRDKETLRFVKYINHCLRGNFQTISFTYYE